MEVTLLLIGEEDDEDQGGNTLRSFVGSLPGRQTLLTLLQVLHLLVHP